MKRIVLPIRVADRKSGKKIISFSRINKRVMVSDDTWQFIEYLSSLKRFNEDDVKAYVQIKKCDNEINTYNDLLEQMELIGAIEST